MATPAPAPDQSEHAPYYRGLLHDLLEAGRDVIRLVQSQANAPQPSEGPDLDAAAARVASLAVAYDRASRAIRRSVMLAQRLDRPASVPHRAVARKRIIREVEDAIDRDAKPYEKEHLHAELDERLDGPDLDDDIDSRPIPEIIADICRDLGLVSVPGLKPFKRRTPADIAALCARAAGPAASSNPPSPLSDEPERFFRLVATPNGA